MRFKLHLESLKPPKPCFKIIFGGLNGFARYQLVNVVVNELQIKGFGGFEIVVAVLVFRVLLKVLEVIIDIHQFEIKAFRS